MTAFHMVRFRLLAGAEADFIACAGDPAGGCDQGLHGAWLLRFGPGDYCLLSEWDSLADLAAAGDRLADQIDRLAPFLAAEPAAATAAGEVIARHRFDWPDPVWCSG